MTNVKMIFIDMDGTLLNSKNEITEMTKRTISLVRNVRNIPVILISSRMPSGMLFLQKELGIDDPIVCYSGSLILCNENNILLNKTINSQLLKYLYDFIKTRKIHMSMYESFIWYVEDMDYWAKQESEITRTDPKVINYNNKIEEWEKHDSGPNKILCMGESYAINKLNIDIKSKFNLNASKSKPTYLEIMPNDVSKITAIKFLSEKYNVQISDIMAIGDNFNDIDMIKNVGYGIAMGNAPDEVKLSSRYVTLSNDNEGVVKAIEKFVFSTKKI